MLHSMPVFLPKVILDFHLVTLPVFPREARRVTALSGCLQDLAAVPEVDCLLFWATDCLLFGGLHKGKARQCQRLPLLAG